MWTLLYIHIANCSTFPVQWSAHFSALLLYTSQEQCIPSAVKYILRCTDSIHFSRSASHFSWSALHLSGSISHPHCSVQCNLHCIYTAMEQYICSICTAKFMQCIWSIALHCTGSVLEQYCSLLWVEMCPTDQFQLCFNYPGCSYQKRRDAQMQ